MPPKITVVLSSRPDFGGGYQYSHCVWQALKSLDREKWDITAVCLSPEWAALVQADGYRAILQQENTLGRIVRWVCKQLPGGAAHWRRLGRFFSPPMRALQAEQPILAIFPCEAYLSLGTSLPILAPIHDLMYIYERRFPEVGAPAKFAQRRFVDLNVCRYGRGILVDSETGRRQVIESYPVNPEHVHVLPYVAPPQASEKVVQVAALPFERYIFYPAQLWAHKNHINLLRAMALLNKRGVVVNAIFCGSKKSGADSVLAEVNALGLSAQVAYLGFVEHRAMGYLYERAVALVMPTYFGPTNIPPLEAFARGCPVAVSGIYGMREQLGDAALYFTPGDEREIAQVVERLWVDDQLRNQLIRRGEDWLKSWNQEKFNLTFLEIVQRCLTA